MCKFMDSDCYCVVVNETCDQLSCDNCETYKEQNMSLYEYLYTQEERDINRAITTIKNMKNVDLKEKYKDYH